MQRFCDVLVFQSNKEKMSRKITPKRKMLRLANKIFHLNLLKTVNHQFDGFIDQLAERIESRSSI